MGLQVSHPTLRAQVLNNYILPQNLYYNSYLPKPKYLLIGSMDPYTLNPKPYISPLRGPIIGYLDP